MKMARYALWLAPVIVAGLGVSGWIIPAYVRQHCEKKAYRHTLALQLRIDRQLPSGTILFFGDSHIAGLCVSCIAQHSENFGIGKETTRALAERVGLFRSVSTASVIVLLTGFNDLKQGVDPLEVSGWLRDMVVQRIAHDIPVIVISLFDVTTAVQHHVRLSHDITTLNEANRTWCTTLTNCHYLDFAAQLADLSARGDNTYYLADGIHLSTSGNRALGRFIEQALPADEEATRHFGQGKQRRGF